MGKPYLRVTAPAFLRDKKKKEVSITDERSGTRMEGNALNEKQKTTLLMQSIYLLFNRQNNNSLVKFSVVSK